MANVCENYPCHDDLPDGFSCEFCYCPEYNKSSCSGTPIVTSDGTKDCSLCVVNHKSEYVTEYYTKSGNHK